jgi:uncharacterized protein
MTTLMSRTLVGERLSLLGPALRKRLLQQRGSVPWRDRLVRRGRTTVQDRPPPVPVPGPLPRSKDVALMLLPPLLLASTTAGYRVFAARLGPRWGYFAGFLSYWGVWALLVPLRVVGRWGLRELFRGGRPSLGQPRWIGLTCLLLPPLLGYSYAFPRQRRTATPTIVLASAGLALVNGTLEEVLWRGLYATVFPNRLILGYLYPTIGFAVWHVAPQTVVPSPYPGGTLSFVGSGAVVGLLYGWVAWRTRSIRWTTVSHVLFDFSGLGGRIYFER